jgi:hypothetical protein
LASVARKAIPLQWDRYLVPYSAWETLTKSP